MYPDRDKSKQELIAELRSRREEVARLKGRLSQMAVAAETCQYAALIIEHSPVILFRRFAAEKLPDRRMAYVSPNISRFGYAAEDFLSNRIMFRQIVHPDDAERVVAEIKAYVDQGVDNYIQVYRITTKDGGVRWIEDHTSVVDDPDTGIRYHQGIVVDITGRKEAEEKLRRSETKFRRIVETTGEGFLLMDKDLMVTDVNQAFCRLVKKAKHAALGNSVFDMIAEGRRGFLYANREEIFRKPHYEFETVLAAGDGELVPVLVHGNTLYGEADQIIGNMAFITDMTAHKKALILAGEVQKSLMPQAAPEIQGLDIAGKMIPCDEIGGDYFDFIMDPQGAAGPFTVVVGDISGHGVDSSLLMATARAILRMRSSQPGAIPEIVGDINQKLTEDVFETGKFMTLLYLTVAADRRHIAWVRAGHEPAWLYDPRHDTFTELKGPGIALGVEPTYRYRQSCRADLEVGQLIVVGTDGVWEGHNKAGEMFGKQRLQAVIRRDRALPAQEILDNVFRAHRRFTQDARNEDDLTLVIMKITR
jgi:sigma-B regulation protein RsbU (phosphoserine phosphatase)